VRVRWAPSEFLFFCKKVKEQKTKDVKPPNKEKDGPKRPSLKVQTFRFGKNFPKPRCAIKFKFTDKSAYIKSATSMGISSTLVL